MDEAVLSELGGLMRAMNGPKGFTRAPTWEELQPTPRERHLLRVLWDWQEASKRSPIVLGEPCAFLPAQVRSK